VKHRAERPPQARSVAPSEHRLRLRDLCAERSPTQSATSVYSVSMPSRRVNITIDAELHDRAKAVLARLPAGATFSALVEDAVSEMVPALEATVDAFEAGGEEGALRAVEASLGRALLSFHTHEAGEEDAGS